MAITSDIRITPDSRLTRLATAIARWSRGRTVEPASAEDHARQREALHDRMLMHRELQEWKRELERTTALQRVYRGV